MVLYDRLTVVVQELFYGSKSNLSQRKEVKSLC